MRVFLAAALLVLVTGCAETEPPEFWLTMDETLTLDAIDAHVERSKAEGWVRGDSLLAEAYRASLQGWHYKAVAQDTIAARTAYEKARALGFPTAAFSLARLDLGATWRTDFSHEASLAWLRAMRTYADEGDSLTAAAYAERLADLKAEQAAGNDEANTLLALWEAELRDVSRQEAVEA
ncbi:MAG: hypothetical protein AAF624_12250 [Bacteroidota bacterium]